MRVLVIFGPPAVGKMTVGREIAARSSFRLLHNHATIEPLLEVFDHGTAPFDRLLDEFRIRVIEEAAASGIDLVITFVWPLDDPADLATVERYLAPYAALGAEVAFVELAADLPTRLGRNRSELRLLHKPSKRDVEWSDNNVRRTEQQVVATTAGVRTLAHDLLEQHRYLRMDNSDLSAGDAAERVLSWLEHPRIG